MLRLAGTQGVVRTWGKESRAAAISRLRALLRPVVGSARDLTPIMAVIPFSQFAVLRQPVPDLGALLVGLVLVLFGLVLFVRGLGLGLFPLGESMATE